MKGIDFNEWRKAIAELSIHRADVVPAGWISVQRFAAANNMGISTARHFMSQLYHKGRADRKDFVVISPTGRPFPVPHYKLKKPDANNKKLK